MATNLAIDPGLIEPALELSGERTKKAAVTRALREFIARREQKDLLGLMGWLSGTPPTTTGGSGSEPLRGHQRLVAGASPGCSSADG